MPLVSIDGRLKVSSFLLVLTHTNLFFAVTLTYFVHWLLAISTTFSYEHLTANAVNTNTAMLILYALQSDKGML